MSHTPSDKELLDNAIPIDSDEDQIQIVEDELEPIDLAESQGNPADTMSKIRTFGERKAHEEHWDRQPNATGTGAIHVKTFISKLRLDAIEHLDAQVNHWLDAHPEYEVKMVTTNIGPLHGKRTEDALFMSVWV